MTGRIVYAEPEPNAARMVEQQLETAGFEVVEAWDVASLRSIELTQKPDLMLIDAGMQRHGGLELLSYIRQEARFSGLPVIVLGNSFIHDDIIDWLDAGADGYIPHPFSAALVIARVKALLRRTQRVVG
ncbi:MAG: response regulator [Anaerolineales bacterium]|nr:response regulator [Anaerolineales bacterium]